MTIEFKLPDIGEGTAEGEIVQWLVAVGDAVEEHQAVVEVMTDKATVEIPAPAAGVVTQLCAEAGETVPVGSVIFHLDTAGGAAAGAPTPDASPTAAAASAAAPAAAVVPAAAVLEFQLPDIGEGTAEGEIVRWIVEEGTQVEEHQAVVEVMTDKATVEIPSPAAGVIVKQLAAAGEVVAVGSVIFHLAGAGAVASAAPSAGAAQAAPAAAPMATAAAAPAVATARAAGARVLAVPSARRVARELGVDLTLVAGSGNNGVIRRADVEAHAAGAGVAASAAPTPAPVAATSAPAPATAGPMAGSTAGAGQRPETRVPFRGMRRKIAEAMVRSKFTAPHFTVVEEVDVTDLVRIRTQAKAIGEMDGVKVTYLPFIMKAVALCLERFPMLNGRLDEATEEIIQCGYADLGIATDTPNGLVVPVIRDVGTKSVMQLAKELGALAERTREGKVSREELAGSTFTITNAGNLGGILATPIINYPDIAILGVHRLRKAPGVVEGPDGDRIEVRQFMNFSLSVDHRLADGADGARMLAYLRTLLENPGLLAL
jgi:pyruvate dehydrogenase E2 component (dihydrolipoamide acetyltransferase)